MPPREIAGEKPGEGHKARIRGVPFLPLCLECLFLLAPHRFDFREAQRRMHCAFFPYARCALPPPGHAPVTCAPDKNDDPVESHGIEVVQVALEARAGERAAVRDGNAERLKACYGVAPCL
jgi:hypothetical protein